MMVTRCTRSTHPIEEPRPQHRCSSSCGIFGATKCDLVWGTCYTFNTTYHTIDETFDSFNKVTTTESPTDSAPIVSSEMKCTYDFIINEFIIGTKSSILNKLAIGFTGLFVIVSLGSIITVVIQCRNEIIIAAKYIVRKTVGKGSETTVLENIDIVEVNL